MQFGRTTIFSLMGLVAYSGSLLAQSTPKVPEWAQPGSATHTQVAPPADFHRASTNFATPIGIFEGQSDIGSAVVPGGADLQRGDEAIHDSLRRLQHLVYTRRVSLSVEEDVGRCLPRRRCRVPRSQWIQRPQGCSGDSPESRRRLEGGDDRTAWDGHDSPRAACGEEANRSRTCSIASAEG